MDVNTLIAALADYYVRVQAPGYRGSADDANLLSVAQDAYNNGYIGYNPATRQYVPLGATGSQNVIGSGAVTWVSDTAPQNVLPSVTPGGIPTQAAPTNSAAPIPISSGTDWTTIGLIAAAAFLLARFRKA